MVNFSARCDTSQISRDLIGCGRRKGIVCCTLCSISPGLHCYFENYNLVRSLSTHIFVPCIHEAN